jgi:hypothetical protein
MINLNEKNMISLGGVGSCLLSQILKKLNNPCYIFDNNLTYQSAVINSVINLSSLFIFDKKYYTSPPLFVNNALRNDNNTAFDIHYFKNNFDEDVINVSSMYNRRMNRLIEKLNSNDNKILIRMMHTIESYHPEINGNKEKDNIEDWISFYDAINSKYSNIKLILISKQYNEIFYKNIKNGIYLINDKDIFDNENDKLFLFLRDIKYENI